ncbi:MAG: flagellar protein FliS [Bacteroidetes bacterium]|nr:flagellar protein FliS [Bacteroidota bacterium]
MQHAVAQKIGSESGMKEGRLLVPQKQLNVAAQRYQREQYMNLTPVEVIKKLYDVAILGCKKRDKALANNAVTELIVGLNFEYQEIALGLYRLYQYVKHCLRHENYSEAEYVLQELRTTWMQAFHLEDK